MADLSTWESVAKICGVISALVIALVGLPAFVVRLAWRHEARLSSVEDFASYQRKHCRRTHEHLDMILNEQCKEMKRLRILCERMGTSLGIDTHVD